MGVIGWNSIISIKKKKTYKCFLSVYGTFLFKKFICLLVYLKKLFAYLSYIDKNINIFFFLLDILKDVIVN